MARTESLEKADGTGDIYLGLPGRLGEISRVATRGSIPARLKRKRVLWCHFQAWRIASALFGVSTPSTIIEIPMHRQQDHDAGLIAAPARMDPQDP
jgi:hypothetical protein